MKKKIGKYKSIVSIFLLCTFLGAMFVQTEDAHAIRFIYRDFTRDDCANINYTRENVRLLNELAFECYGQEEFNNFYDAGACATFINFYETCLVQYA